MNTEAPAETFCAPLVQEDRCLDAVTIALARRVRSQGPVPSHWHPGVWYCKVPPTFGVWVAY